MKGRVEKAGAGCHLTMLLGRVGAEMTDSQASTPARLQVCERVQESCTQLALSCCCPCLSSLSHSLPREKLAPLVLVVLKVLKVLVASLAIPGPLGPQVLL